MWYPFPWQTKSDLDEATDTLDEVTDTVGTNIPKVMEDLRDLVQGNDMLAQKGLEDAGNASEAVKDINRVRKRSQDTK